MSNGLNQVFLLGNLGADPELRAAGEGSVLKLRLATTETWLDKEKNKKEKTEWHQVKVFGKRGESLAKYLHKGSKILVQGRLEYSQYEKDGQKKYSTDIIAQEVSFAGGPTNGAYAPKPAALPVELPF